MKMDLRSVNAQSKTLLRRWLTAKVMDLVRSGTNEDNDEAYADFCNKVGAILANCTEYDASLELHTIALDIRKAELEKEYPGIVYKDEFAFESPPADLDGGMLKQQTTLDILSRDVKPDKEPAHNKTARDRETYAVAGEATRTSKPGVRTTRFGNSNVETAISVSNNAAALLEKGDLDGAFSEYTKCLSIVSAIFGKSQPETATTYNNLAVVLERKDDLKGALDALAQCSTIQSVELVDDNHPHQWIAHQNIGLVKTEMKDYGAALKHYRKCLGILQDSNVEAVAFLHFLIGNTLLDAKDLSGAIEAYDNCLTIQESVAGKNHLSAASIFNNFGCVLEQQHHHEEALKAFQRALAIEENQLGKENLDVGMTLSSIASVLFTIGEYDQALGHYTRALSIMEVILGSENVTTANTYNSIGLVKDAQGDFRGALKFYYKCLTIQEAIFGRDHLATASAYYNISGVLCSLQDTEGAYHAISQTVATRQLVLGETDPDTVASQQIQSFLQDFLAKDVAPA
jgi:tetratricopeptide (TPR) repeat protein